MLGSTLYTGIILSTTPHGEEGAIVRFFTEEQGILACYAKGRAIPSPLTEVEVFALSKQSFSGKDQLLQIQTTETLLSFQSLRRDRTLLTFAQEVLKATLHLPQKFPAPEIFRVLKMTLLLLAHARSPHLLAASYLAFFLTQEGFATQEEIPSELLRWQHEPLEAIADAEAPESLYSDIKVLFGEKLEKI